ncbi:queuosine precursor transporter [soil metagenome]
MNEIIFCIHLLCIGVATLALLRFGLPGLVSFLCMQAIIANLFVLKQINLLGLNATSADVYIVGSVLTLNLIQEFYGKLEARKAIWISFALLVFYTIVSQIQIAYTPSHSDFAHDAYQLLLSFMPRITIASMVVYLIVQYFDTFFYGLLRRFTGGGHLTARNMISIFVSQLLDTVLFSILGLYGIVENIAQIMIVSFTIKMVAMLALTPLVMGLVKRLKK